MGYVTPVDGPITDTYQAHLDRNSAEPGVDFAADYDTPIRAAESGTVVFVGWGGDGPGNRLEINLDDGRVVDYIDLNGFGVRVGDRVSRGQSGIAFVGSSGSNSTGPHVHVTLRARQGLALNDTLNFMNYVGDAEPSGPRQLTVDGILGSDTVTRWQEVMGTYADGLISFPYSDLVAAVQNKLNAAGARDWDGNALEVDGQGIEKNIGTRVGKFRTIWALQNYVGIDPDGYLDADGSDTIRRVQGRLNANTF